MRATLILLIFALAASPALAQTTPSPAPKSTATIPDTITIPPELTDPRFADRLTDVMMVMTKAFLELPVGEVQAAVEGRKPTAADSRRTVRTETGMTDQQLKAQIEQARPMMQASFKAMAAALPAMMKGMTAAAREMEKATANLPSPTYPKQ